MICFQLLTVNSLNLKRVTGNLLKFSIIFQTFQKNTDSPTERVQQEVLMVVNRFAPGAGNGPVLKKIKNCTKIMKKSFENAFGTTIFFFFDKIYFENLI